MRSSRAPARCPSTGERSGKLPLQIRNAELLHRPHPLSYLQLCTINTHRVTDAAAAAATATIMATDAVALPQALNNLDGLKQDLLGGSLDHRMAATVTLHGLLELSLGTLFAPGSAGAWSSLHRYAAHCSCMTSVPLRTDDYAPIDRVVRAGFVPVLTALLHPDTEERLLVRVALLGVVAGKARQGKARQAQA